MAHDSAQPCGCDPGAKWLCEDHRLIRDTITATLDELENAAPRPPLMAPSLGACPTCDGYAINASEAPYCPSCARERESIEINGNSNALPREAYPLTGEYQTRYMLRLKLKVTGDVSEHSFDSMTARNLFIFTLGPWADVQEEWTA